MVNFWSVSIVSLDGALCTDPQRRLRDPWPASYAVAGLNQIPVEREVVHYKICFERCKQMDACAWS
jgi:hypothetical protein